MINQDRKTGILIWQVSNYWQNKLRKILKEYNMTLNEYLVLHSITEINKMRKTSNQSQLSFFSGIDISVVSVVLKLLEKKKLIKRNFLEDSRKKNIEILFSGKTLFHKIHPKIVLEEEKLFKKINEEKNNFYSLLKLILGKKLRIKADKYDIK